MLNRTLGCLFALLLVVPGLVMAEGTDGAQYIEDKGCVGCHGKDGNAMLMGAPKLGGQKAGYIVKSLMDYKSGARNNAIMSGFATALSEEEMEAIAKYFEEQPSTLTVPKH